MIKIIDYREDNKWSVYIHTSPSGKYYVGITSKNPKLRWQNGTGYRINSHFRQAVNKYGWDNILHDVIAKNLTKQEALQFEIKLISILKSDIREFGYNKTKGGDGVRIRDNEIPVLQYDLNGTFIKRYNSIREVISKKDYLYHSTKIKECCEGKRISIYKSLWCYEGESNNITNKLKILHDKSDKYLKRVILFNTECELIGQYDTIYDASKSVGVTSELIRLACNSKSHKTSGYIAMFFNDGDTVCSIKNEYISSLQKAFHNISENYGNNIPKKNKINNIRISRYTPDMQLITRYDSIKDASKKLYLPIREIREACNTGVKIYKNSIWRYENTEAC